MQAVNQIVMQAEMEKIFETAADLSLWPIILPHYRWVKYLEKSPQDNVVVMAAKRKWIPIKWTSRQEIDPLHKQVRFLHLKAFTKGMRVVWTFDQVENGVLVKIEHQLSSRIPIIGPFIANVIVGKFFIDYVANQTLRCMKAYLETSDEA